jgi:uncharacterized membrane protein YqjE
MVGTKPDWVPRALAVVGGLGSFATLVTVTGGAITWIRFAQAELPADQAVAATPQTELLTIGAVSLVSFGLVGMAAVLVAYVLDPTGRPTDNRRAMITLSLASIIVAVWLSDTARGWKIGATAVVVVSGWLTWKIAWWAVTSWGSRHSTGRQRVRFLAIVLITVCVSLLALVVYALTDTWVGVMVPVVAVLSAGALSVADRTKDQFRWFGVAIFTAVLIFGATMSIARTAAATKLQSVAVVLTAEAGGAELSGVWVASADDRVYIADVKHCTRSADLRLTPTSHGRDGRIIELPRASIKALALGKLELLKSAKARGPLLLDELRERLPSTTASVVAPVPSTPCTGEGILDEKERRVTKVDAAAAEELAKRFRPILRFDTGEAWRPLRIESLMAERNDRDGPAHRVCVVSDKGAQSGCEPLGSVGDISGDTKGRRIIDLAGDKFGGAEHRSPALADCPGYDPDSNLRDCDRGPASAIYYRVVNANGRYYVDYWWFLRYNRFAHAGAGSLCKQPLQRALVKCFDHEGDWEGVTAVTVPGRATQLASVGYASHDGVYRHAASDLERSDQRPEVFVAQGSHASYHVPCPQRCAQPAKKYGIAVPETNTDGSKLWGRNSDEDCFGSTPSCLQPLPARSWNAFEGRWGSRICKPGNCRLELGPDTPSKQQRYKVPWCARGAGHQLVCDGEPLLTPLRRAARPPATRAAP